MAAFYLRQKIDSETAKLGSIRGVAYSGSTIPEHGPWDNLIVDLATLTIAKEKIPILRDHSPAQVAGYGKAVNDGTQVTIEGTLFKKSTHGTTIIDAAEEGFEWEMSLGVFDADFVEVTNEEINGQMIEHGWALYNGVLREVSVVALGADRNTNSEVFSQKKGESFMLTKEQWIKFACACGGHKDSTPEEMEAKFAITEEEKAKMDDLQKEVDALKEQVAAKQAEIDAIKAKEEEDGRTEDLKSALDAKKIEMSAEKIADAAKSVEKTAMLLSVIESMPAVEVKKIDAKLAKKVDITNSKDKAVEKTDVDLANEARQLVKDGKFGTFMEAILSLRGS